MEEGTLAQKARPALCCHCLNHVINQYRFSFILTQIIFPEATIGSTHSSRCKGWGYIASASRGTYILY